MIALTIPPSLLRVNVVVTVCATLLLVGCPAIPPAAGDGGSALGDGGPSETLDGGDIFVGDLERGHACLIANDLCGASLVCAKVFNAPESIGPRCWPTCEVAGPCLGKDDLDGACVTSPDGAAICVVTAKNLDACGDAASSSCADNQVCVFGQDATVGHCVTPCSPADAATCANDLESIDCGCSGGLSDCSTEGIRILDPQNPELPEAADGVCIAPTQIGESCGTDPVTQNRSQCSPGQRCQASAGGLGACEPQ